MYYNNEVWRIKVPKKVRFFIWQKSLLDRVNIIDRLLKRTLLVGSFCCLLRRKAEEDLDNLFSTGVRF